MRIITCSKNSITSNLSKCIFSKIRDLRETINNSITNANEFNKHTSKLRLSNNSRLISLSMEDLFSNIPLTRSLDKTIHRLNQAKNSLNQV